MADENEEYISILVSYLFDEFKTPSSFNVHHLRNGRLLFNLIQQIAPDVVPPPDEANTSTFDKGNEYLKSYNNGCTILGIEQATFNGKDLQNETNVSKIFAAIVFLIKHALRNGWVPTPKESRGYNDPPLVPPPGMTQDEMPPKTLPPKPMTTEFQKTRPIFSRPPVGGPPVGGPPIGGPPIGGPPIGGPPIGGPPIGGPPIGGPPKFPPVGNSPRFGGMGEGSGKQRGGKSARTRLPPPNQSQNANSSPTSNLTGDVPPALSQNMHPNTIQTLNPQKARQISPGNFNTIQNSPSSSSLATSKSHSSLNSSFFPGSEYHTDKELEHKSIKQHKENLNAFSSLREQFPQFSGIDKISELYEAALHKYPPEIDENENLSAEKSIDLVKFQFEFFLQNVLPFISEIVQERVAKDERSINEIKEHICNSYIGFISELVELFSQKLASQNDFAERTKIIKELHRMSEILSNVAAALEKYTKAYFSGSSSPDVVNKLLFTLKKTIKEFDDFLMVVNDDKPDTESTDIIYEIRNGNRAIAWISVDKMIDLLISNDDKEFHKVFFLTINVHSQDIDVLNKLIQKFNSFSSSLDNEDSPQKAFNCVQSILYWIENSPKTFLLERKKDVLLRLSEFLGTAQSTDFTCFYLYNNLRSILEKEEPRPVFPPPKTTFTSIQLLNREANYHYEIAKVMTWIDADLFSRILPWELVNYVLFSEKIASITAFQDRTELVRNWVVQCILEQDTIVRRANTIITFMQIANDLYDLNNFAGFFSIFGGIYDKDVRTLQKTMQVLENLKNTNDEVIAKFEKHKDIVPPEIASTDYSRMRALIAQLRERGCTVVPHLEPFRYDLLDLGTLERMDQTGRLANFSLCTQLYSQVRRLTSMIAEPFNIDLNSVENNVNIGDILHYLNRIRKVDRSELEEMSAKKKKTEST